MMLGSSGGAPSFDSRPPGSLAPGGPVGGDGSEVPLPPPANVPLQRPPGQSSGERLLVRSVMDFLDFFKNNACDDLG